MALARQAGVLPAAPPVAAPSAVSAPTPMDRLHDLLLGALTDEDLRNAAVFENDTRNPMTKEQAVEALLDEFR
jgi:hypothetical protein